MCQLIEKPIAYDFRDGVVHITTQYGEYGMLLGTFVADTKLRNSLARQWVAGANKPSRIGALKGLQGGEGGH